MRPKLAIVAAALVAAAGWSVLRAEADEPAPPPPPADVEREVPAEIWAILDAACVRCHRPQQQDGGLDMTTRALMLEGGSSGPAFVPEKPDESLMLELIEFDEMPPRGDEPRVTKEQFDELRAWIVAGAPATLEPEESPSD